MIQKNNNMFFVWWLLMIIALMQSTATKAAIGSASINISVVVEVTGPTCTINGGASPFSVDFGNDVVSSEVNGRNYAKNIIYSLQCQGGANNSMRLKMSGTSGFESQYLSTTKTGLGVAFYLENNDLPLNQWRSFSYSALPTLQAAPIRQAGTPLVAGGFTANSTLYIEYQ